jgi:hypothetical protein
MRPELPEGWVRIKWPKKHVCPRCGLGPKNTGGFLYSRDIVIGAPLLTDPLMQAWYEHDGGWTFGTPTTSSTGLEYRDHWSRIDIFGCTSCEAIYAHDWGDGGLLGETEGRKNLLGKDMQYWMLEIDVRQPSLFGGRWMWEDKALYAPMEVIDG